MMPIQQIPRMDTDGKSYLVKECADTLLRIWFRNIVRYHNVYDQREHMMVEEKKPLLPCSKNCSR